MSGRLDEKVSSGDLEKLEALREAVAGESGSAEADSEKPGENVFFWRYPRDGEAPEGFEATDIDEGEFGELALAIRPGIEVERVKRPFESSEAFALIDEKKAEGWVWVKMPPQKVLFKHLYFARRPKLAPRPMRDGEFYRIPRKADEEPPSGMSTRSFAEIGGERVFLTETAQAVLVWEDNAEGAESLRDVENRVRRHEWERALRGSFDGKAYVLFVRGSEDPKGFVPRVLVKKVKKEKAAAVDTATVESPAPPAQTKEGPVKTTDTTKSAPEVAPDLPLAGEVPTTGTVVTEVDLTPEPTSPEPKKKRGFVTGKVKKPKAKKVKAAKPAPTPPPPPPPPPPSKPPRQPRVRAERAEADWRWPVVAVVLTAAALIFGLVWQLDRDDVAYVPPPAPVTTEATTPTSTGPICTPACNTPCGQCTPSVWNWNWNWNWTTTESSTTTSSSTTTTEAPATTTTHGGTTSTTSGTTTTSQPTTPTTSAAAPVAEAGLTLEIADGGAGDGDGVVNGNVRVHVCDGGSTGNINSWSWTVVETGVTHSGSCTDFDLAIGGGGEADYTLRLTVSGPGGSDSDDRTVKLGTKNSG